MKIYVVVATTSDYANAIIAFTKEDEAVDYMDKHIEQLEKESYWILEVQACDLVCPDKHRVIVEKEAKNWTDIYG